MAIIPHPEAHYFVVTDEVDGTTCYGDFNGSRNIDPATTINGCLWYTDLRRATCFNSAAEAAEAIKARSLPDHLAEVAAGVSPTGTFRP